MNSKEKPNLSRKRMAIIPLSDKCKSVLLGSLLGDGSLKKESGYKNLRFKMRHSENQKDYFEWKCSLLQEISTPKSVQKQEPDGYSTAHKLLFKSGARSELTELWKIVCNNTNTMVINRHWLNHMTPMSLAVWWFDDGSLTASWRKGVFCTDNFPEQACKILAQYLQNVWNINCRVRPIKRVKNDKNSYTRELYYRLWLNNEELRKLFDLVLPFAATRFSVNKCLLIYKDSDFQQRWISKMKGLLPLEGIVFLNLLLEEKFSGHSSFANVVPNKAIPDTDLVEEIDLDPCENVNENTAFGEPLGFKESDQHCHE